MMRKFKKILCAALASTMVLAMAAPSFAAAEGQGTITIERPKNESGNVDPSHSYNVYRLFILESHDGDDYAYIVENQWKNFLVGEGFTFNGNDYLLTQPSMNDTQAAAFAKRALEYAKTNSLTATTVVTTDKNGEAVSGQLDYGYYLVDSTVGSLCYLDTTTDGNTVIHDKNVAPSITKTVNNDDIGIQIGQDARYTITVTAQPNTNNYVIHDKMSSGLTLNESTVVVKLGNATLVKGTDYTIVTSPTDENCTFEIDFADDFDYAGRITAVTNIEVTYGATANAGAVDGPMTNTAKLTYNEGEETPDVPDVPNVYTYQFDLQKIVRHNDGTFEELSGAEFELYDVSEDGEAIAFIQTGNTYRVATAEEKADANIDTKTTITAGNVTITGLDKKTYYLKETKAPTGYNKLDTRWEVKNIKRDSTTARLETDVAEAQVENNAGVRLPSTGGIGTTIFYAVGIILMAGAVFFVVRRKRA